MFEGKLNLETELITAVTWFLICTLVHSVSLLVSFLCLEMIPGQCVHELISLYLSTSQVPSPAHLSQPSSLQDNPLVLDLIERGCCGGGRGVWWAGDMRVSQPSRSGALWGEPFSPVLSLVAPPVQKTWDQFDSLTCCLQDKQVLLRCMLLLLLLSCFSCVQLCATPEMVAHQAPLSLGFSRQEYWSGLPFPSPMHESEKWKWSCSVVSDT